MPFYDKYVLTEPEWLLRPFILGNEVSTITGEPGAGKDIWLADVSARLTRGWPMPPYTPDDPLAPEGDVPGYVILATPEDSPTDTIGWRLQSAGADMRMVYDLNKVNRKKAAAGIQRTRFSIPTDYDILKHIINSLNSGIDPDTGKELEVQAPVHMAVLGPLSSIATSTIAHNQSVRQKLIEPAQEIAEESGIALVFEMHFNRGSHAKSGELMEKINGSFAGIIGAIRANSAILRDDINPDLRRVLILKNNLIGKHSEPPLEYIIYGGDNDAHVRYRMPAPDPGTVTYEQLQARIIGEIAMADRPVTSQELAAYLHLAHTLVRQILTKATFEGILVKRRGAFTMVEALPAAEPEESSGIQFS